MERFFSTPKTRVAVLGGALDPPTLNHLLGASEVIHSGMADQVWLMPCGPRPDKPNLSQPLHRYIMAQIAVNTYFSSEMPIHVSDFEVMAPEAFATYDSLTGLSKKYPDKEFSFVIGTDWLQPGTDLRQWTSKDAVTGKQIVTGDKLVSEFEFLVIKRPGYDVDDVTAFGPRMKLLVMPEGTHFMEGSLSSTEVRKRTDISRRVKDSLELVEGLVPPAVLAYIHHEKLYGASTGQTRSSDPSEDGGCMLAVARGLATFAATLVNSLENRQNCQPELVRTRSQLGEGTRNGKTNVAVFGGAFDPPTMSHMLGLAEIIHSGLADEAMLIPCGPRPDKPHLRSPILRYCMCQLACTSAFSYKMPVRASPIEVFEEEAMATYDSLCKLREQEPDKNFIFVIGSDWLQPGADLRKWTSKDPKTGQQIITGDKLVSEFDFVVMHRPGYEVKNLEDFGPRMKWVDMPHGMKSIDSNLSSTEVRRRANLTYKGKATLEMIDGLVPSGVYNYIVREDVYKDA